LPKLRRRFNFYVIETKAVGTLDQRANTMHSPMGAAYHPIPELKYTTGRIESLIQGNETLRFAPPSFLARCFERHCLALMGFSREFIKELRH
jgi:hypothetical protein